MNQAIDYNPDKMFHPEALTGEMLQQLMYANALEEWTYFDTVLISGKIGLPSFTALDGVGYFDTYAAAGAAKVIPFFKTRNNGIVSQALCNMDQKDRMAVPFHLFGIAVQFFAPLQGESSVGISDQVNHAFWTTVIPQHTKFSFKVGQVEKMNCNAGMLPASSGLVGNSATLGTQQAGGQYHAQNFSSGKPSKWNIYPFRTPIGIARNESIEGKIEFSDYAQDALTGMVGPGAGTGNLETGSTIYGVAGIQVKLLGVRETQFRNLQHY
jgi:hypothetical protein